MGKSLGQSSSRNLFGSGLLATLSSLVICIRFNIENKYFCLFYTLVSAQEMHAHPAKVSLPFKVPFLKQQAYQYEMTTQFFF